MARKATGPKKILVADDEKPLARAFQLKLESAGFEVKTVFNGQDAVEALKGGGFDLVLLDMVMPTKNGIDVLAEMQSAKITTPVIVVSNLSQTEDLEKAKHFGNVVEYFIKSEVPLADIVARAKKALGT